MALPKLTFVGFTWMATWAVVPFAVTNPEQPFKSAAEKTKINALAAHNHPLKLVFTFLISFGASVSWSAGAGGGDPQKLHL